MKAVLLDDEGYTADGDWRLVKVEPTNNGRKGMADQGAMVLKYHPDTTYMHNRTKVAMAVFKAMIASSPSPVLAEAVSADGHVQTGINSPFNACMYREDCKLQKEHIAELEARNKELQSCTEQLERELSRACQQHEGCAKKLWDTTQELNQAKAKLAELENQEQPAHKGATHCENCGCTWLDDGLNPIGCPYCKGESK